MTKKKQVNVLLSVEAERLLAALGAKTGKTRTEIFEYLIREAAAVLTPERVRGRKTMAAGE